MANSLDDFGKIFIGVGLGAILIFSSVGLLFILFAEETTVACRRLEATQGRCEITALQGPWRKQRTVATLPLDELQKAVVEESSSSSSSSSSSTYRVTLVTERGDLPLSNWFDSEYGEKFEVADQINTFLQNQSQPSLKTQYGNLWGEYLFGGFFILMANLVGIPFLWIGIQEYRRASR